MEEEKKEQNQEQIQPQEPEFKQPEISPEQKLESVLQVLSKKKKVQEVALERGVSRESVREWKNKALEGMEKALENKERGRKPKNYVKEDELRDNLEEIQEKLKVLEKEKARLEEEKKKAVNEMWMARRAISFIDKNFAMDAKKNAGTKKVLKEIFSNIPKKPYKAEAE